MRSEGVDTIREGVRTGNKKLIAMGLRKLATIVALYTLAGAGTDALKDLLFGRRITWKDAIIDNILKLIGLSRYIAWTARKEGIGMALTKIVTPPAINIIEAPLRDVWALMKKDEKPLLQKIRNLESLGKVPIVGKHYYWWFGGGRIKEERREEKRLGNYYVKFKDKANHLKRIRKMYNDLKDENEAAAKRYYNKHTAELRLTGMTRESESGRATSTVNIYVREIKKLKDSRLKAMEAGEKKRVKEYNERINNKSRYYYNLLKSRMKG